MVLSCSRIRRLAPANPAALFCSPGLHRGRRRGEARFDSERRQDRYSALDLVSASRVSHSRNPSGGKLLFGAACLVALLPVCGGLAAQDDDIQDIENSVIKIYTTQAAPDYFVPWRLLNPRQTSGSGVLIDDGRILTNAHVVADASYVQVQKHNDPQRYQARVRFVSHEADLALITVDEAEFHAGLKPLAIGELPNLRDEVSVFGYPVGGQSLSITKGVLSRVEHQIYAHASSYLLAGQIDAAINPGNSGGPVVVDRQIVGIVMQSNTGGRAENLGYFIPPSVIRHVLRDSEDGAPDGFPDLGFRTQTLESPAAKAALGLREDQRGVIVIKVFEGSPADGVLAVDDVIAAVDGYQIADDGSIRLNDEMLTNYKYAIDQHHVGDAVPVTFTRRDEQRTARLAAGGAKESYSLVNGEQFDRIPEYYLYGGVLFVPLNMNLIKRWGNDWSRAAPISLLEARNEWASPERRELVVALQVMAADVNLGYHDWRNWVVHTVNGESIRDFDHFVSMLRRNRETFVVFRNENGYQMVIDHEQALASEEQILARYRIPSAYSSGLLDERHFPRQP